MAQTCYRHPDRETAASCSSCGRPICPECMTPTPVGMRCPECARQKTKVVRGTGGGKGFDAAPAMFVLIGLNVLAFLAEIASGAGGLGSGGTITGITLDFGLFGPSVADGEWYRIVTSGFLHAGLFHLGFNMFALYVIGQLLEPALGTPRFVALYFASLIAGSFGALLLDPNALTVGASGAVFGIFGATMIIARGRGMNEIASQLGLLLVLNLAITFWASNISVGAHLGGLAAGLICAVVIVAGERGYLGRNRFGAEMAFMVALAAVSFAGAISVA
ncbi:MAG TPA: rhomboid family intramembrane serine protease [Solirubrobacterales bacterium]|nr:rhomboid family intramembrane serine protease [Solirubrobacterales bacterium]